jgi:hypothetical protein
MPSDQEIEFHRSFLSLAMSLKIWNDDYTNQNNRGGPPGRQNKMDADPVFAYHVRQGPHWPAKPPGDGPDKKYNALLARTDGSFEPLVIITKRGMTGQNFASVATNWEQFNSVLCPFGGKFNPVVNSMMEVTGHYGQVVGDSSVVTSPLVYRLIHPKGISFTDPAECIANGVPLYLWLTERTLPEGWESFRYFNGGIDVVVLTNGEVIGAVGHPYTRNNGTAISVMSPLDFWAPGSRLLAGAIRSLTNRVAAAFVRGIQALRVPTQELAEAAVLRLSGTTLSGMGVARALPLKTVGRRTIIMGDDMAKVSAEVAKSSTESGFYDVVIHGNAKMFGIIENGVAKEVSVSELANAIRPNLAPGDKIRLLGCKTGSRGGPAQQLANELNRTVWAPSETIYTVQGDAIKDVSGKVVDFTSAKSFVPIKGGKFYQFDPAGGSSILSGPGRQVNQHVIRRTP